MKLYDNPAIKSASLHCLKALKEKDIMDKHKDTFYFCDPMFEYWLRNYKV